MSVSVHGTSTNILSLASSSTGYFLAFSVYPILTPPRAPVVATLRVKLFAPEEIPSSFDLSLELIRPFAPVVAVVFSASVPCVIGNVNEMLAPRFPGVSV